MKKVLGVIAVIGLGLWLNNSSWLAGPSPDGSTKLIAHRGIHHVYAGNKRDNNTCRAEHVEPITHTFIENTLPSMREAFAQGADVVEIDVHLTPDNVFAVFHDWRLDCQTNGTGVTHKQEFAMLKALDLGYGITASGTDFPLRGKGIGLMPSLEDVLSEDIGGPVLINFKSNRVAEGTALAAMLGKRDISSTVFGVYGGGPPTHEAKAGIDNLRGFSRDDVMACVKNYMLLGWSGHVPEACKTGLMPVPMNYAPLLWGWPHRFTARMKTTGTEVILVGPYDGSGLTSGIDTAPLLADVPSGFDGYVWTNKIEIIGPLLQGKGR